MAIFLLFFSYLFLHFLSIFWRKSVYYDEKSLTNLTCFFGLISLFFIASSVLAARFLLDFSMIAGVILLGFSAFILTYQFLRMNQVDAVKNVVYSIVGILLSIELFWALSFLPHDHQILAFVLSVCYFLFLKMSQLRFHGALSFVAVRKYLVVSGMLLAFVLITAPWR
jgi:hypothetical protein